MKTIKPIYFDNFKCKANACIDSCCSAGWQVDVDSASLTKYCNLNDEYFKNVNNYVDINKSSKTFKQQNGKCVFLKDGLCSLVLNHGDKYLCDVCRSYPRFYNFCGDVKLMGLSLDCEEVASMVLGNANSVQFVSNSSIHNKKVDEMLAVIKLLQNRNLSLQHRINTVLKIYQCQNFVVDNAVFEVFKNFEWLNFDGEKLVEFLRTQTYNFTFKYSDAIIENLLVYFVYRHFIKQDKTSSLAKLKFAIFATMCCDKMQNFFDNSGRTYYKFKNITTFCRQVEYSAKNLTLILNYFNKN